MALTEEGAYRGARNAPAALGVMEEMAAEQELDGELAAVLREILLTISNACLRYAAGEIREYRKVMQSDF